MADVSSTCIIIRGMGYIALMTICPSKRCLPANWHCIRDILRYRSLIENASARNARVVCSKQRNSVEDRWIWTNGQDKNGWGMNRFHGSLLLNIFLFFFLRLFDLWNNCDKFRLIYFLLKRNSVLLRLVFFFFSYKKEIDRFNLKFEISNWKV